MFFVTIINYFRILKQYENNKNRKNRGQLKEFYTHQIEITNKGFSENALEEFEATLVLYPQRVLAYAFSIDIKLNEVFTVTTKKLKKHFVLIKPGECREIGNSVSYKCNHDLGGKCALNPNCKVHRIIPFIPPSIFSVENKQYVLLHLIEKPMCKNTIYFEIAETIEKR